MNLIQHFVNGKAYKGNSNKRSKVFNNLESSLGDIDILIATSARFRNKNVKHITLENLNKIDFRKKIGFLFGSEASGLIIK